MYTKRLYHGCFILLMSLFFMGSMNAQEKNSKDFSKIDNVISNLYQVISGPAGARDWDLFKSLFHEKATMGAVRITSDNQRNFIFFDVEGYMKRNTAFFEKNGFYEEEIGRKTNVFGGVAQVYTAYQFRLNDNTKVSQRGINCIQLVYDSERWYITNIVWESESEKNKIPNEMIDK